MINLCTVSDVRSYLASQPAGVKTARVTAGGHSYTSISISAVSVDGNGSGATFTGILNSGVLVGVTITAPGTGYTQSPTLSISGDGTGATASAFIADDYQLSLLVARASAYFLSKTNRPQGILPVALSEYRDGNGGQVMVVYNWPIISVQGVTLNGVPQVASSGSLSAGYVNDTSRIILRGAGYPTGFQNILLAYTFGWATLPDDIVQAVIELTAQKYRRAQHVDQTSQKTSDNQVITFSTKEVPPEVQCIIDQYRIKAIIE